MEQYIAELIKQKDLSWFPIGKAYEISDLQEDAGSEAQDIETMQNSVSFI